MLNTYPNKAQYECEYFLFFSSVIKTKGVFIVCCNAAILLMYQLLIYCSSTQSTAPQAHFLEVVQCSSQCRDGNTTTATNRNADAV